MIDERLLRMNPWIVREQELVHRGKQGFVEVWAPTARNALIGYVMDLLAQMSGSSEGDDAVTAFCERISPLTLQPSASHVSWPPTFMSEVEASLRNSEDHEYPVADWFLGNALFEALVARAQPSDGLAVARMLASNSTRLFAFTDRVANASTSELGTIVLAMRAFVLDECSRPESHLLPGRRESLGPALESWAAESDLGAVWDSREWMGLDMLPERLGILTPLAAVKPIEFLALIEEISPLPLQQGTLQWRSITLDLDKVLGLLEKAPVVIDQQSEKWNKKVVAPLLLEIAFDLITQLSNYRQDDGQPLATEAELAGHAQSIINKTLARLDGIQLVARWMQYQVYHATFRAVDGNFESVFNASLTALAGSQLRAEDVYPHLSEEYPNGGGLISQLSDEEGKDAYERLILAAMIVQERVENGLTQPNSKLRLSLLSLMRKARKPFTVGYREVMPSWRHHVVANLYVAEVEPAKTWLDDFNLFALERRASLHYSYSDDNTLMIPSLFFGGVALSIIDRCLGANEGSPLRQQALTVWGTAFEATRLLFTHWSLSSDAWRNVATALFARYPGCLAAHAPTDPSQVPAIQPLAQLGGDEALVASALANLLNNGMNAAAICGTPTHVDIMKRRIQNYLDWEGSAGSRNLPGGVSSYLAKNFVDRTSVAT